MDIRDTLRRNERRDESDGIHMVTMPAPHAGVGDALRRSFGSVSQLPDEWGRLLNRLR
jgi:hypothetical protein